MPFLVALPSETRVALLTWKLILRLLYAGISDDGVRLFQAFSICGPPSASRGGSYFVPLVF